MIYLFTKPTCPFCDKAKSLLNDRGIIYQTVDINAYPIARKFLHERFLDTVPQLFKDDVLAVRGGYSGMSEMSDEDWQSLAE